MADELQITGVLYLNKSGVEPINQPITDLVTVSGNYTSTGTQLISTAGLTLTLSPDIGTIGFVMFQNLDGTNYITIGADGSSYPIRMNAGELAGPFRFNGASIYAKADTAACRMAFWVISN
jgi:hypothetical protein